MLRDKARRIHSRRRFEERFGVSMSKREYDKVKEMIRLKRFPLLGKQSHTRYAFHAILNFRKEVDCIIIYNVEMREIVTFLPSKWRNKLYINYKLTNCKK